MNALPIIIFFIFVLSVLALSFYFGKKTKSAKGYFVAGGNIHWGVNGISFAGDYLSAASFLGICGLIATQGFDGFLYSIGYLAGWIVALFIVAEPMKRLGKYTFTDALDAKYDSKGIKLVAAISTLVVSIFYLIPQMVGAGVLVTPLLGLEHHWGVIIVGVTVILIVATAGMASTTYVQFLKGALLIVFSVVLVISILGKGLTTNPTGIAGDAYFVPRQLSAEKQKDSYLIKDGKFKFLSQATAKDSKITFVKLEEDGKVGYWKVEETANKNLVLKETQWSKKVGKVKIVNGQKNGVLMKVGRLLAIGGYSKEEAKKGTGSLGFFEFLSILSHKDTLIEQWPKETIYDGKVKITVYYPKTTPGNKIMVPGQKFKVDTFIQKLNFISLMLALFFGTAALPHVLIRYYTVKDAASARKSTIVAIAAIGFFYILTLFMGLGGSISGVLNPASGNMAAPLLAKSIGVVLFAIISAIAFATVLGTVSGLIVAASGAVAHDLMDRYAKFNMTEKQKVFAGKIAAFAVGGIAIVLGIVFKGVNVSFLVGWAFAVAASANLPAILMMLFWKKTTAKGIIASISVGIVSSLFIILTGPDMFKKLYGLAASDAFHQLGQPGIISIPLSFITIVVVSLMTQKGRKQIA